MRSSKPSGDLNPNQLKAVIHIDGPLLVVAGAGTGKTKVIVERLCHLIKQGVPKSDILCLTFTEKAAQEMLDRASEMLEESYGIELNIHTFNGFGSQILQEFAIEIGMSSNLRLIGDNGKVVLLRENMDSLGLDYFAPISKPDKQLADIASYFSKLKQQLVKPDQYTQFASSLPSSSPEEQLDKKRHQELAYAYDKYIEITREKNIIDYDDQIYLLILLLSRRPNVLKKLQERYRYVMVDEFQDTNPMQSELVDMIVGKNQNLFVVGDDDQSIYGWRGATLANILDFGNRYPGAKEITLIENYRSTQAILDSAWRLIQHNNPHRLEAINNLDKRLRAHRGSGEKPKILCFPKIEAEMHWIAEDIKKRIDTGTNPGDIAILARGKKNISRIHSALDYAMVEHTVSGVSSSLYKHTMIATLLECLRAISDPHNQTALYHTLGSRLFNIDSYKLSLIASEARSKHRPFNQTLADSTDQDIKLALELMENWQKTAVSKTVREMAYDIITDSGLKDEIVKASENDELEASNLQVLGQWFGTLIEFEQVSSMPTSRSYVDNLPALEAEDETIADEGLNILPNLPSVMTIHKSKGLEWPIVYIIDCTQDSLPLRKSNRGLSVPEELNKTSAADDHYAEERRLMYVASTRAKDELILTYSETHTGTTKRRPSIFIKELCDTDNTESMTGSIVSDLPILENGNGIDRTIKLPASMVKDGRVFLTASQADDYLRCPLNFYYNHVLNIPSPPTPNTTIGSIFHGFLQDINQAKRDGRPLPELQPMLDKLETDWPEIGYSSSEHKKRAFDFSKNALKNMYNRFANENIKPIEIEKGFELPLANSKLTLKGRIDAVLPTEKGVEIRDYKTSSSVDTPEKAKNRVSANNQLTIYSVAWRHLRGEDPDLVSLDFVQTGMIGTVKKQSKTLDKMEIKLAEMADDILAGKFPPGKSHDYCIHPINE